jgi:uncharacterized membrane protein required for colicin V production
MIIDLLLLLALVAISVTGFFQGAIKLVLATLTLYASMLLASLYFKFLALYFARHAISPVLADTLSFLLILAVCFLLLLAAALYTFRYIRLPGRFELLDRMGGIAVGIFLGVVVCSIVAMLLHYVFIDHDLASQMSLSLVRMLQQSTRSSRLLPVLLMHILPQLYTFVAPLLPNTALPLFTPYGR